MNLLIPAAFLPTFFFMGYHHNSLKQEDLVDHALENNPPH